MEKRERDVGNIFVEEIKNVLRKMKKGKAQRSKRHSSGSVESSGL